MPSDTSTYFNIAIENGQLGNFVRWFTYEKNVILHGGDVP